MLKKTVTYIGFNEKDEQVQKTRDCYFNMTTAELLDMQYTEGYQVADMMQVILDGANTTNPDVKEKANRAAYKLFSDLLARSYGEKSEDGEYFIKKDKNGNSLSDAFKPTEAYSQIFMELLTNGDFASKFISKVLPLEQMERYAKKLQPNHVDAVPMQK